VDKRIDLLQQKHDTFIQYKNALMQGLFPRKGQTNPSMRLNDKNNNPFTKNWQNKKLGDYFTFFSGGTPNSTNTEYYKGNIQFIGSGDIHKKFVNKNINLEALNNSSSRMIKKGDLLYSLYGANSGDVAISKMNGAINQAILCIRSNKYNTCFLYKNLLFRKEFIISKYIQGGQGNLSANIIRKLKFHFPELEEQNKIVGFLSSVDKKIENISNQLNQSKQFKKSLMQKMFI
ncbi:MAG: restriction endonuclease subunit S, partial [Alphaproteobacteria bacterium]|nr:restriction endonuclease subunit S [Alphaproteobacteria bacterium]